MKFLRQVDFFGIPFTQQIDMKQSIYKSIFGGIVTLMIFSASLAYSIWIFYQWESNQLSPKISSSIYASDFKLLDLNYDIIKLYFWKFDDKMIDPFKEKILIPLMMYTTNYSFTESETLQISNESTYDGKSNYIIPKMNLGFQKFNEELYTTTEMYIQIIKCSEIYLKPNEKCASQELIDQFYQQPLNMVVMQIHYKSLDSKDGSEQVSFQEFFIQLEQYNCYTLNTFLQSSFYEIKNSFLFESSKYVEYINGALIQPQTNSNEYCKLAYQNDVLGLIYIVMKGNQVKTIFEYPHVGDLLANIGSIVSVLFMIKYLIILVNQYFLNQQMINQLIELYYPEFKFISVQRNWKNQIKIVKYQNNQIDVEGYNTLYKKINQQMRSKLCFMNLLYEISRIQLIIRSTKSRDEFRKSHQIGFKLNFQNEKDINFSASKSSFTQRPFQNQLYLTDDEVDILSLNERKREKNSEKIPDELFEQNDFYEINKIL